MAVRRLIVLGGPFPREEVLDGPEVEVGRSAGVGLVLGDGSVSRHHARILERAEGIVVEDRGSTFGTYINDRRLPPGESAVLRDGDVIRFGQVPVVCRFDEEPADPDRALRDALFVARANARVVLLEDGRTRRCPLADPTIRIGSAPDCEVRLLDPAGPPEEARILAVEGAFRIEGRCAARPPRLGDLPLLPGRPEPLPPNSVVILRRAQGLFLHDFDGEGRPVPDPLARIPRRRLLRIVAARTGLSLRLLRRLAGGCPASGRALGEALVEKGLITPLLWMSVGAVSPPRPRAGRRMAILEKIMDLVHKSSRVIALLFSVAALAVLPGCGWVPALVGGLAASGSKGSDGPPAPTAFEARPAGTFLALDGEPTAIAIGDFIPDPGSHLDAAIISKGERLVSLFEGDGTGRLSPAGGQGVSLSGDLPVRLASIPAFSSGEPGRLLVATANTLEQVFWAEGKLQASSVSLDGRADLARDLAAGDFDGDGMSEAAVSSFANGWVEIFDLPPDGGSPVRLHVLKISFLPESIAAAPYLGSGGPCCLAVLADKGGPHALLFFCPRDGAWCPQHDAELEVGIEALELAKEVFDLNGDGFADVAYTKGDGTGTVTLKPPKRDEGGPLPGCGEFTGWTIKDSGRGGSHFSPVPAGMAIFHLPGGLAETADRITIDRSLGSIICSYFVAGGKDFSRAVTYSLPGEGIAMAPGDLNGDGRIDLAAISREASRSFLTTLLANPPVEGVRNDPFSYLSGSRSGEVSISEPNLIDIASGHYRPDGGEPFLTAIDRTNEEVTVFYLGLQSGAPVILRLERYEGFGITPGGIGARDLDLDGDDDIVVVSNSGYHILRNLGASVSGGPRFAKEPEVAVGEILSVDPSLDGSAFRFREHFTAGQVDRAGGLDLVIPIIPFGDDVSWIAVILDAGSPALRRRALLPAENPRQVTIARLNGDDAPDLMVACDAANKIQVFDGIEGSPGTFSATPREFPGLADKTGIREVRSSGDPLLAAGTPFEEWPVAEWLVAANSPGVTLYCRKPDGTFTASAETPQLYSGLDPEGILVTDLFGEGRLDLAIADENLDRIIFMKALEKPETVCRAWQKLDEPPVGSPQHFAPFHLGGIFYLAVASRADQSIHVFRRKDSDTLAPEPTTIPLLPEDTPGSPAGLAAARTADGGLLAAALVEDAEEAGLAPAVDLLHFPREPVRAFLPERERIELDGEARPAAILLADVDGDEAIDLMAYDEETRSLGWHRGIAVDGEPTITPEKEPEPLFRLDGSGSLLAALLAPTEDSSLWVAVATGEDARIFSIDRKEAAGRLEWVSREREGPILGIAPGRAGPGKDPRRDLWVAVLEPRRLAAEFVTGEISEVISEGKTGRLSCAGAADIDGDGYDDLAAVEADGGELLLRVRRASGGDRSAFFPEDRSTSVPFPRYIEPVGIVFLDANGDEKIDIAVGTRGGDVFIFQGNGAGEFAVPGSVFAAPGIEGLCAADIDGDGKAEILAAAPVPGLVVLPGK